MTVVCKTDTALFNAAATKLTVTTYALFGTTYGPVDYEGSVPGGDTQ